METISRHLEDLLAFHVVAEKQSFTQAAEVLGSSKSAVSKQVKRLETYLKTPLFFRSTRSLKLSEEGKALFIYSRKILDLSDEASKKIRDFTEGDEGVIKIACPMSFADEFAGGFLSALPESLKKVKIEFDVSNEVRDFIQHDLDFAIRAAESTHPDLIVRYLGKMRDVICASPKYLGKNFSSQNPTDLSGMKCILHSMQKKWNAWNLVSARKEVRVEVSGHYATNQYMTARKLCLEGMGVARLPYYLVEADIAAGKLIHLYKDYEIATHSYYLVYHKKERASKRHQQLREQILRWFKDRHEIFV